MIKAALDFIGLGKEADKIRRLISKLHNQKTSRNAITKLAALCFLDNDDGTIDVRRMDKIERWVEIVIKEALPQIVNLLHSTDVKTRRNAARAIANLSHNSDYIKSAIFAANAIPHIVPLLQSEDALTRQNAVRAIYNLSHKYQNEIVAANAPVYIAPLLQSEDVKTRTDALHTISNLSRIFEKRPSDFARHATEERRDAISNANAIPYLVELIKPAYDDSMRRSAACAIVNLSENSEERRDAIFKANAIPYLLKLFKDSFKYPLLCQHAVRTIANLSENSEERRDAIFNAQDILRLWWILSSNNNEILDQAYRAISNLSFNSVRRQNGIIGAGLVDKLQSNLSSPFEIRRRAACCAIANLSENCEAGKNPIFTIDILESLKSILLNGDEEPMNKDNATRTLSNLNIAIRKGTKIVDRIVPVWKKIGKVVEKGFDTIPERRPTLFFSAASAAPVPSTQPARPSKSYTTITSAY